MMKNVLIFARRKSSFVRAREPANAGLPLVALVSSATQGSKLLLWGLVFLFTSQSPALAQMQKLKIGPHRRFLVKENGEPFVWIGETNWFFAKLPPETIDQILDKRQSQKFTMMFVSCRESLYNGAGGPGSPSQPNEAWWAYLDSYVEKCAQRNLYVGITLGWWGVAKKHNADTLYDFGRFVGHRYRNQNNIIWLTLGESGGHRRKDEIPGERLEALVRGIRDGDTGDKLLTIHADYQRGTSLKASDARLVDFNNWQTSQWTAPEDLPRKGARIGNGTVWEAIAYDYGQRYNGLPKPTLDSEAKYENNKDFGGSTPFGIRRRAYFTIFAGAFGHTYGAGGIWDGLREKEGRSGSALDALHYTGAEQIGYLSQFLQGLGDQYSKLRPDQDLIVSLNSRSYDKHIQASVASDGQFALVYSASDDSYVLDLTRLKRHRLAARWYSPRDNTYHPESKSPYANTQAKQRFDPPGDEGPGHDWVLMLGVDTERTP